MDNASDEVQTNVRHPRYFGLVTEGISKKQVEKLGRALRAGTLTPHSENWFRFQQYLADQDQVLESIEKRLRGVLGFEVEITGRTKSTDTLREKLIRTPSIQLPYIRDVVGLRVVGDFDLSTQDKIVAALVSHFGNSVKGVIDRRVDPSFGYRAVHVIVDIEGSLAEIQVRTSVQSHWAEVFEALADKWGRQIRYGSAPSPDSHGVTIRREEMIKRLQTLSLVEFSDYENAINRLAFQDVPPEEFDGQMTKLQADVDAKAREWLNFLLQNLEDLAREAEKTP